MLFNINNKSNFKIKYNTILNNFVYKENIKIIFNIFYDSILNYYYNKSKKIELYNIIKETLNKHIKNKYGFYIINVNLKFDYKFLINKILKYYKYIIKKILIKDYFIELNLLIYEKKIFIISKNLKNFIDLYENEDLNKKLIKKFYKYEINFILFCYENLYETVNKIIKKKINDIVFIDCLQKFVINNYNNYKLIKFLNFKNIENINTPIHNNLNYINSIYFNVNKINFNIYDKPHIERYLKSKLFNQDEIIKSILSNINIFKFKKNDDKKPIGSWLLCGPSGSGKTELAKILTYSLFDSYDSLIKIDMSEYMESNSSSKLIGSPPGYAGYGEDTVLSKRFKNNSSFVLLFDEIEKADKSIFNLMLQILDEGRLTLSNGVCLKFDKSFIIFTSNIGYSNNFKTNEINKQFILDKINNYFKIEFLNRLNNIIIFNSIDFSYYDNIFNKFIKDLSFKFLFYINFNHILKNDFTKYLHNVLYGSRPIKRWVENIFYKINYYKIYLNRYEYNIKFINNLNNNYLLCKKSMPVINFY